VPEAVPTHDRVNPLNSDVTKTVVAHVAGVQDVVSVWSVHMI
jgi:hypothetical protein